jgi:flagellin
MEKLSSGLAINRAADNPAGLVISEHMRARIASLNQEIKNVSGQLDKYRTADSTIIQLRNQLTEMRSLALAVSNDGGIDEVARQAYQNEIDNLVNSYSKLIQTASFGSQNLLDGSAGSVANITPISNLDLSSSEIAQDTINKIDEEITRLDGVLSDVGAVQKIDLEGRLANMRIESENLVAAESTIRDLDYAREISSFLKDQLLLKSGMALLSHTSITPRMIIAMLWA